MIIWTMTMIIVRTYLVDVVDVRSPSSCVGAFLFSSVFLPDACLVYVYCLYFCLPGLTFICLFFCVIFSLRWWQVHTTSSKERVIQLRVNGRIVPLCMKVRPRSRDLLFLFARSPILLFVPFRAKGLFLTLSC